MNPTRVFSGLEYRELARLSVYAWKRKDDWLYVGVSNNGFARLLHHNMVDRAEQVLAEDELIIWSSFENWEQAAKFEAELNEKYRPKYSLVTTDKRPRVCPICGTQFTPSRHWQKFCRPSCRMMRSND